LADPRRAAFLAFVKHLAAVYRSHRAFWQDDPSPDGFRWIDASDRDHSIISYARRDVRDGRHVLVALNLTPVPRAPYRIGVPTAGEYRTLLNTDASEWGGSGFGAVSGVQ